MVNSRAALSADDDGSTASRSSSSRALYKLLLLLSGSIREPVDDVRRRRRIDWRTQAQEQRGHTNLTLDTRARARRLFSLSPLAAKHPLCLSILALVSSPSLFSRSFVRCLPRLSSSSLSFRLCSGSFLGPSISLSLVSRGLANFSAERHQKQRLEETEQRCFKLA